MSDARTNLRNRLYYGIEMVLRKINRIMVSSIQRFFQKIHLIITNRAYLFQVIRTDKVRWALFFVLLLFFISTFISALVRYQKIENLLPQKIEETIGVLQFSDGVIAKGLEPSRDIVKRDLAEILSLVLGIDVDPKTIARLRFTTEEPQKLQENCVQLTSKSIVTTKKKFWASIIAKKDVYSYNESFWDYNGFSKESFVTSEKTISAYFETHLVNGLILTWLASILSSLYLLVSHVLIILLIVFFYSRNMAPLQVKYVRTKLVFYLLTPYFVLYPLFSITTSGLEYVTGVSLIVASIIMLRLFQLLLLLNPPKETSNE